jgi:hypothetical protein
MRSSTQGLAPTSTHQGGPRRKNKDALRMGHLSLGGEFARKSNSNNNRNPSTDYPSDEDLSPGTPTALAHGACKLRSGKQLLENLDSWYPTLSAKTKTRLGWGTPRLVVSLLAKATATTTGILRLITPATKTFRRGPRLRLRMMLHKLRSGKQGSMWGGFEVSHPKRKDKDALRMGHPAFVPQLEKTTARTICRSFDSAQPPQRRTPVAGGPSQRCTQDDTSVGSWAAREGQ